MKREGAVELRTPRLLLRRWRDTDLDPFAALNADPAVMEHFPSVLDRSASDALAARARAHFDEHGFGPWAVECPGVLPFAGFVGLSVPSFEAAFTPCVEIGWRLSRDAWGRGWATEAARESLRHGFEDIGLDEIVAFTIPANLPSIAVMERLGMEVAGEFDHPKLASGHPMRRHVLRRLTRRRWRRA